MISLWLLIGLGIWLCVVTCRCLADACWFVLYFVALNGLWFAEAVLRWVFGGCGLVVGWCKVAGAIWFVVGCKVVLIALVVF